MEITRLSVEGVGRFEKKVTVEGFGPGVNILSAANEAGKSTLFRALRSCIFERHTSKNGAIKLLETDGVNLPVSIAVDFTQDGHDYRIAKSFLRSAGASLIADGREIAKKREADEMLWEILGIEQINKTSVDQAAFAMLWVGQRDSFNLPPITKAGGDVLGAAIESEVGAVVGSEQAKAILAAMRSELAAYVTEKTGKPLVQGPLGQALRQRDACREELAVHAERLRLLETQFSKLEQLRAEQIRLADPALAAQHTLELAEARHEQQAAKEALERLSGLEAEERRCHLLKESAAEKAEQLKTRAEQIRQQRERIGTLAAKIDRLGKEETQLRQKLAELRVQVREIDLAEDADSERDRILQQLSDASLTARVKSELERKAALLRRIIGERTKMHGEFDACKVTAEHLRALEDIERELGVIGDRLAASASKLSVSLKPGSTAVVQIDGRDAEDGESLAITAPITVSLGDVASFTVTPPEGFGVDQEKARTAHLKRRQKLFETTGASGLAEARKAYAQREELESALKRFDTELSVFDVEPEKAEAALAEMRRQIARFEAEISEAMARAQVDVLPDASAIDEERNALGVRREAKRSERKRLEACGQEFQPTLERAVSEKAKLSGELDELQRALAANLASSPDDTRETAIAETSKQMEAALTAHQQAAGALAAMRAKTPPPEEIERLNIKAARLEQAIANRKCQLAELEKQISNLEGQIQSAGGDGLGERVAALESQVAQTEADVARHQKRVDVLSLLGETISEALDESRERFYTPILRHLKPFVNDLFSGANIDLGEGYQVSGLRRNGDGGELFQQLSDGTQEQIAVLARLAIGALLAERGRPVPIILDDALVFSDDERIERMFDALNRAGGNQQIIVLTCRTQAFSRLGGRSLRINGTDA